MFVYKNKIILILFIMFHYIAFAEGTKEIMQTSSSKHKLYTGSSSYGYFANYNCPKNRRLNITVCNLDEIVYFGYKYSYNAFYQIKDPSGKIVKSGNVTTNGEGYIKTYEQAVNGPAQIVGSSGYYALFFEPTMTGDYYIEFSSSGISFDFFDITVANKTTKTPIKGRIWSKAWSFSATSSSAEFDGTLFVYSDDMITTSIDFNGMQPIVFTISANATGCFNSGNPQKDRMSVSGNNTYPQYKIFLNEPDTNCFPTGTLGTISIPTELTGCPPNKFCIDVTVNKEGKGEVLIDLNGIIGYQTNSKDVLKIENFKQGKNCVEWDGLDALGNKVPTGTKIRIYVKYINGLTHLPIFDVENNKKGIKVKLIKPITSNKDALLYWDDSNIKDGTSELNGCSDVNGCHKFPYNNFGNERTINTWWYVSDNVEDSLIVNFTYIAVNAGNDTTICSSETTLQLKGKIENAIGGKWSGGTGTFSNDTLMNPIYTFSATDKTNGKVSLYLKSVGNGNCNEQIDTINITIDKIVKANAGADQTICAIPTTLIASGGTTYTWNTTPAKYTATISVSPTAKTTYIATIKNMACSGIDSVVVSIGSVLANAGSDQTICKGDTTTLMATGGTTYSWSNGKKDSIITISPSTNTTYYLTAYSGSCIDADTVIITVSNFIPANAGPDQTICKGETIILSATTGADKYSWDNNKTTQNINVKPNITKTYKLTMTTGNCSGTDNVIITVNPIPTVNAGNDQTICKGTKTYIKAIGTPGSSYKWNNSSTSDSTKVSPTKTTTYIVTANLNGCTAQDSVVVNVALVPTADAGANQTVCDNNFKEFIFTAFNDTNILSYSWSNNTNLNSIKVTPTQTTTYTLTVNNAFCSATDQVVVLFSTTPKVNLGNDTSICLGNTITLSTNSGYTYTWSNAKYTNSITVTPIQTTTYSISVTNQGCSASDNIIITVNDIPENMINKQYYICEDDSFNLLLENKYSYLWDGIYTGNNFNIKPSNTQIHILTTSNNFGCERIDTFEIIVKKLPVNTLTDTIQTCKNEDLILTANGGNYYKWETGENTQSIIIQPVYDKLWKLTIGLNGCHIKDSVYVIAKNTPSILGEKYYTICKGDTATVTVNSSASVFTWSNKKTTNIINVNPTKTTTYIVTATENACTANKDIVVIVNNTPLANLGNDKTLCEGDTFVISAKGGVSYLWNTLSTEKQITISPTETSLYVVTITDANNCSASDDIIVYIQPKFYFTFPKDTAICIGKGLTIKLQGADTYLWDDGRNDSIQILAPSIDTKYFITVTKNVCYDKGGFTLKVLDNITISNSIVQNVLCYGDSTGSINIMPIGGTGIYNYNWSNEVTDTNKIEKLIANKYSVTISDAIGCYYTKDFEVEQAEKIAIFGTTNDIKCYGEKDGMVNVIVVGGTKPYTYSWNNNQNTKLIENLGAGDYSLTITDSNNCLATADYKILQTEELKTTITTNDATCNNLCNGTISVQTTGGIEPYKYIWSNGQFITNIYNLCSGNYTFTVYDYNACSKQYNVTIKEKHTITIDIVTENLKCNNDNTGKINLAAMGGTPDYQYLWKDGKEGKKREELTSGSYSFSVYDNNGCQKDSFAVITQPDSLYIEFAEVKEPSCFNDCNGEIKTNVKGGTIPYQYIWNNNVNTDKIENLCAGTYSLTIQDKNNCFASSFLTLDNPTLLSIATNSINANCINDCNGTAYANITGGKPPYNFKWSNEEENQTATNLCPEKYYVTATDSRNCSISSSVQINTNSSIPNIHITTDKDTIVKESYTNLHLIQSNLYIYKWINDNDLNQTDIFNPTANPSQSKYFYATITDQYNCYYLDSIMINVIEPSCDQPYIFIPNTFTPNGDNQNDVLYLRGLSIKDFHLSIFDRWGEKIFETYDQSVGWDGTYKGKQLASAVYTYYLELTCPDGYQLFKKGNITLIR
ncbi:MAG: hypothetical protein A2X12_00700 [Bacteroidetes bacterium GWE2_29_8]|nr:MAG: hypothetical protein A2X12_00700 [Bacteroidetes bacterium GWE2_29_8]OFY21929.1 MAG: hypothetical protein A2X02_01555 [Bacteroidetes bacterium GWF2_29_10]